MPDYGTVYREAQGRILSLVNNQNAATPVPACPGWTVKDVVGHLSGVLEDLRSGNLPGWPMDDWTAAQVERSRQRTVADIGATWHVIAHTTPRLLVGEYGETLVSDIVSHEFDIRGALGNREGRSHPSVRTAALFFLKGVEYIIRENDLPTLRIQVEDKAFTLGDGDPAATVTMTWYETLRTCSGRRSVDQVRSLPWDGEPDPWREALFIFGPAEQDIVE